MSAHYGVTPHLAHREQIYQFPNPFRVVLYGPDIELEGTRLEDRRRAGRVRRAARRHATPTDEADWDAIAAAFELVEANESWELYRATARCHRWCRPTTDRHAAVLRDFAAKLASTLSQFRFRLEGTVEKPARRCGCYRRRRP